MEEQELQWYCRTAKTEFGPMTLTALRKLASNGHLLPTDHVRRHEDGKWLRANLVTELYQSFDSQPGPGEPEGESLPAATGLRAFCRHLVDYVRHPSKIRLLWSNSGENLRGLWSHTGERYLPAGACEVTLTPEETQELSLRQVRAEVIRGHVRRETLVRRKEATAASPLAEWRPLGDSLARESFSISALYQPLAAHAVLGAAVYTLFFVLIWIPFSVAMRHGPLAIVLAAVIPFLAALPFASGTFDVATWRRWLFSRERAHVIRILALILLAPVGLLLFSQALTWAVLLLALLLTAGVASVLGVFTESTNPLVKYLAMIILGPVIIPLALFVLAIALMMVPFALVGALVGGAVGLLRLPLLARAPRNAESSRMPDPRWAWIVSIAGLAAVALCIGLAVREFGINPATDFNDFKTSIAVEQSTRHDYVSVEASRRFPLGEVRWAGTLRHMQPTGDVWLLQFSELELPEPLQLRFVCPNEEATNWVPYIGRKVAIKGSLSDVLVAGYGGPPMGGGSEFDRRIVFEKLERFPFSARKSLHISRRSPVGKFNQQSVSLNAIILTVGSVQPLDQAE